MLGLCVNYKFQLVPSLTQVIHSCNFEPLLIHAVDRYVHNALEWSLYWFDNLEEMGFEIFQPSSDLHRHRGCSSSPGRSQDIAHMIGR